MKKVDLIVKNANLYLSETDTYVLSNIIVNEDKFEAIMKADIDVESLYEASKIIDADGMLLLPGGIDPHVHLRDPGNTERETFATGTMAAAAGGVTTLIEHPISKPPQYNVDILDNRISIANKHAFIDFGFVGAAGGKHPECILELSRDKRVLGYKTFLHEAPNGRDLEFKGLTMANDYELYKGLSAVAETGMHCLVHAEDDELIKGLIADFKSEGKTYPLAHLETRPTISEVSSVARVIEFARETGASVEFCHISTPEAAEIIADGKKEGLKLILETCPHYLLLSSEELDKFGPFAKCNPPLRKPEDRDKLWAYIEDGSIDIIGSDHAPFLMEEKTRGNENIFDAMSGFPGIDLRLPLMLTEVKKGKLSMKRCIELLSKNPAKVFGIYPQKGNISVGADADFTIVDFEHKFTVSKENMYTKSKDIAKVYDGWELYGKPLYTVVRGNVVLENGYVNEDMEGIGNLVTRFC